MACEDSHLAEVIVSAVHQFDPSLIFLAPGLSELENRVCGYLARRVGSLGDLDVTYELDERRG